MKKLLLSLLLLLLPVVANSAAMSNYAQNALIDHIFRGIGYTPPTTLCVALTTATPTAANTGATIAEASYTGYARGQLNPSVANWLGTGGNNTGPSAGITGTTSNGVQVVLGTPPGSGPIVVTSFVILDSCTIGAGNVLFWGVLNSAKTISVGNAAPVFNAGSLTVKIQ